MAVNAHLRPTTDRLVLPIAKVLAGAGVTPNILTTLGLIGVFVGMAVVLLGYPIIGGWVTAAAVVLDALDGTVARVSNKMTKLGSFYDSVADRAADSAIFGAAAWVARDEPYVFTVIIVALASALITSYIRAKAESLGWDATVGIIERPERLIIILLALGYGFLHIGAWLLAVGGVITIAQRLHSVYIQAKAEERAQPATS